MPSRRTSASTRPRPAPSAMRSPMSCVRCATTNDITPKMPTPQAQRHGREAREEHRREAVAGHRLVDELLHRLHVRHRQVGIAGADRGGDALLDGGRGARACGRPSPRPARDSARTARRSRETRRLSDRRCAPSRRRRRSATRSRGPSFVTPGISCSIEQPLRQRVHALQVAADEDVVDDGHRHAAGAILLGEGAALASCGCRTS